METIFSHFIKTQICIPRTRPSRQFSKKIFIGSILPAAFLIALVLAAGEGASQALQKASGEKLDLLFVGPLASGRPCSGAHPRVLRERTKKAISGLEVFRLLPDDRLKEASGGRRHAFDDFKKDRFRLARDFGRRARADFVFIVDRHIEGLGFKSGCVVTSRLIDVNDPNGLFEEEARYTKDMTPEERLPVSRRAFQNLFNRKARAALRLAIHRKAAAARQAATAERRAAPGRLKLLVLGPFDGHRTYATSTEELRSVFAEKVIPTVTSKFDVIYGDSAIAPLKELPEAKNLTFESYYDYPRLTDNNYRLARMFARKHGADFVALLARDEIDARSGGQIYLALIDVEDERGVYRGSGSRQGNIKSLLSDLLRDFITRARPGIEKALVQKSLPPTTAVAKKADPAEERLRKLAEEERSRKEQEAREIAGRQEENEKQKALAQEAAFELAFWDAIKNSKNAGDYQAYLQKYPDGQFAPLAKFRAKQYSQVAKRQVSEPPPAPKEARPNLYGRLGRYHALVVGINNYRNITPLKTAKDDAIAVAEVLERDYGFKVRLLLDATRYEILAALSRLRAELTERDNLLIYYAGHGFLDKAADTGYWLPADADKDITANWIGTHDLQTTLRAMNARHVMVVADSCYSGTLTRSAPAQLKTGAERLVWLKRMAAKRSRTVLSAGGFEPVLDSGGGGHSVFAKAFLDALRENDWVMEGQQLFGKIQRPVVVNSNQTPEYGDIRNTGHDGGDFLFVRKE